MQLLKIFLLILGLSLLPASYALASKTYVYCSSGKIELDNRDPNQMKSSRGNDGTYVIMGFEMKQDAVKFAERLGGVGAQCPRK